MQEFFEASTACCYAFLTQLNGISRVAVCDDNDCVDTLAVAVTERHVAGGAYDVLDAIDVEVTGQFADGFRSHYLPCRMNFSASAESIPRLLR